MYVSWRPDLPGTFAVNGAFYQNKNNLWYRGPSRMDCEKEEDPYGLRR